MSTASKGIEVALLNSDEDPAKEVALALLAVARFAIREVETPREAFVKVAGEAWDHARSIP